MRRKATSDVWWKNAVLYCLSVQTFLDSDGDGRGDLQGLTDRLDYLAGIGVTCVWLMPFYSSPGRDDGYDISDFDGVDGKLGTPGDFAEFIRTARDRGIRVLVDLVMNHTSDEHRWFRSARADRDSPYRDFYVWVDERPEEQPGDVVFPDKEQSNWAWDEEAGQYYLHRFYSFQPDLNVANPEVRDEIAQVVGYWLDQGLSGFRVDAVPFMLEPTGLPKGALHDPHKLLRDLSVYLSRRRGDAILMGEVNLEPDEQRAFFGEEDGDELHMSLELHREPGALPTRSRARRGPRWATALRSLPRVPGDCQWANFVRNHDELTLDKLAASERAEVFAAFGPEERHQLYGRGLRRRLPTMLGGDGDESSRLQHRLLAARHARALLRRGDRHGGEPRDRGAHERPLADAVGAERHDGFTTADRPFRPLADDPGDVNVALQRRDPHSLLNWMERLIRRRKECPELGWGSARCSTRASHRCSRTAATGRVRPSSPSTTSPDGACVPRSWSRTRARTPCSSTCSTTTSGGWATAAG